MDLLQLNNANLKTSKVTQACKTFSFKQSHAVLTRDYNVVDLCRYF